MSKLSDSGSKARNGDNSHDGVIYETTRAPAPLTGQLPEVRPRKSNFAYFYVITLFAAVVICIVVFAIVFNMFTSKTSGASGAKSPTPTPSALAVLELSQMTGVVKSVNNQDKSIAVLDCANGKTAILRPSDTAAFKDKYGAAIAFAELAAGDIVDISLTQANRISSLSISSTAWTASMRKNVSIDPESMTIATSTDTYSYDDKLMALHNGKPFDLNDLLSVDVISIYGLGNKALVVILEKSHGYIKINNAELVENGVMEIDTTAYSMLNELTAPIPLVEGLHKIVVRGDNIEPYGKDLDVAADDVIMIDISEAQIKSGILSLKVNVPDYTLVIDGNAYASSETPLLSYGYHTLRVEKDGFIPIEQSISISMATTEMAVELKEILKLGKIIVSTDPEGAKVYIDSAYIGEAPVSVSIELGQHTLTVTKEGFTSINLPIDVDKTEEPFNSYSVELQAAPEAPSAVLPTPLPMQPGLGSALSPMPAPSTPPPIEPPPSDSPAPQTFPEQAEEPLEPTPEQSSEYQDATPEATEDAGFYQAQSLEDQVLSFLFP